MNELILEDQSLETLTEIAKGMYDECKDVIDMIRNNEARLTYFGRILSACRCKVKHGEWESWLEETFGGALTLRTARRWIADVKDPEAKKVRNEKQVEERAKRPSMAEMKPGVVVTDPDPNPEPKTNTKHTAENAKAKESEKPAPRPVAVQAELVQATEPQTIPQIGDPYPIEIEEKTLSDFSIREIGEYLKESAEEPKERAKWLRKLADELDPPKTNEKTPSASALKDAVPEDLPSDLFEAAQLWAEYKQARPKADRIQSLKAWEIALKKMRSQPASVVVRKIENAIANSWKGWDHDTEHGRPLRGDEW